MADHSRENQPTQEPVDLQVDTTGQGSGQTATGSASDLAGSGRAHRLLNRLLRVTYPHDSFPDGPFERTATAVQMAAADAGEEAALAQGLQGLDRSAGGDFLALDDAAAEALLRDRGDDHFFRRIRSTAVVALYDDAEVWGLVGYEGSSFDQGGYLHRGFDDLSWLPKARVEEYDGEPRVELVASEGEHQ